MKTFTTWASLFAILGAVACSRPEAKAESRAVAAQVDYLTVQTEKGKYLRYRKLSDGYLLVLVPEQEIIQSLEVFQKAMKFPLATAVGIGDIKNIQFAHFNIVTKKMDLAAPIPDSNEMTSLNCSLALAVSQTDGAKSPFAHCHVTVGLSSADDNRVAGGHLISATVSVVGEIFIHTFSEEAVKTFDPYMQGNLFDLNDLSLLPTALPAGP